jgi:hypothetical protein
MHVRANGTTVIGLVLLCSISGASSARAQASDSTHRWSLYGGTVPTESWSKAEPSNLEVGLGVDFRLRQFSLPLRANLAFGQMSTYTEDKLKFGTLSLDAVARPLPKLFGTRLFLLGGLGVGTRAAYSGVHGGSFFAPDAAPMPFQYFSRPRQTWMFAEGGLGLDVGKMFLQLKAQQPVASDGYLRFPLSVGFHF